jgi:hypothetical protein
MSRSYTSSPPSASMACSGTALPLVAGQESGEARADDDPTLPTVFLIQCICSLT